MAGTTGRSAAHLRHHFRIEDHQAIGLCAAHALAFFWFLRGGNRVLVAVGLQRWRISNYRRRTQTWSINVFAPEPCDLSAENASHSFDRGRSSRAHEKEPTMTTQGSIVLIAVGLILLFWILDLVRRDRLYVGYGIIFIVTIFGALLVLLAPPLLRGITRLV